MTDRAEGGSDPALRVSDAEERARALADVLRDQAARVEGARAAEARRDRRARGRRGVLVAAWLAAAWVWIFPPSWTNVHPPQRPTLEEEAQSLRLHVFLQTEAIEAYRTERGHLPYVLQEAGPPFRGMEYRRADSRSYELAGRSDRVLVRYTSEEPPLSFVGAAAGLISGASGVEAGGSP